MKVCGRNQNSQLGILSNNNSKSYGKFPCISPPLNSKLDPSLLFSYSISLYHSVWITKKGRAFALGSNENGIISGTLPKVIFTQETEVIINNEKGQSCKFISAVCGYYYTLYLVQDDELLRLSYSSKEHIGPPIFLNINGRIPYYLYGGSIKCAVIDSKGDIILITSEVCKDPKKPIEILNLPRNEKAISVSCCDALIYVLTNSGRLLFSRNGDLPFEYISHYIPSKVKIKEISGTYLHCLAVGDDGIVYGASINNYYHEIGTSIGKIDEFGVINYKKENIVSASAGSYHSLFVLSDGQVFACGMNDCGQLFTNETGKDSFLIKTTINNTTFCIAGGASSVAFIGKKPPPNTPNMTIKMDNSGNILKPMVFKEKNSTQNQQQPLQQFIAYRQQHQNNQNQQFQLNQPSYQQQIPQNNQNQQFQLNQQSYQQQIPQNNQNQQFQLNQQSYQQQIPQNNQNQQFQLNQQSYQQQIPQNNQNQQFQLNQPSYQQQIPQNNQNQQFQLNQQSYQQQISQNNQNQQFQLNQQSYQQQQPQNNQNQQQLSLQFPPPQQQYIAYRQQQQNDQNQQFQLNQQSYQQQVPQNNQNQQLFAYQQQQPQNNQSQQFLKSVPSYRQVQLPQYSSQSFQKETNDFNQNEISKLREENAKIKRELEQIKNEYEKIKNEKVQHQKESNTPEKSHFNTIKLLGVDEIDDMKNKILIGQGGQSRVYRVSREVYFALKEMEVSGNPSENFNRMRNLQLEFEIINRLNHPNIIKTFGICFGDEKHPPSLVLEYCPFSLHKCVKELNDIERITSIFEIASAMREVHNNNLIHRDLKPENILFDEQKHVKLSDFGIARINDEQTQTKTLGIGTLKFMAPEILNECSDYNEKVDIYSFGVVVFFILTNGQLPKITIPDVAMGKKAPIPANINQISRELILRCWSTKSEERPSFNDIIEYIKRNNFLLIDGVEKDVIQIKKFISV